MAFQKHAPPGPKIASSGRKLEVEGSAASPAGSWGMRAEDASGGWGDCPNCLETKVGGGEGQEDRFSSFLVEWAGAVRGCPAT